MKNLSANAPDGFDFFPLIHIGETDSTNDCLARLCEKGRQSEFTVVRADFQTAGKGQRGNRWEAERGKNLLFSFVMYPAFLEARAQFALSQAVALSVKEALEEQAEGLSVKWPNDLYWQEKKLGGILMENDLAGMHVGRCIAGIGLNVNQERFAGDAPNPVSLRQITGREQDIRPLLGRIIRRMQTYYLALQRGETEPVASRYREALFRKEGLHRYRDAGGEFVARMAGVEADGHLLLKDVGGQTRKYAFKEVEYIL